ncbi:MAG: hypothetical protein M4D80_25115 [Myxococcota bacterium]|nr:hypothetical protein [Myxococcota bacterium]
MSLRAAIACVVMLASAHVSADDKVLVLRAEGRADKKLRTKIEGAVLKIAMTTGEPTTAGDVTYSDAAAMVGCKPEEDKCKVEVLGMLSVDEVVTITATPKPGGIEVLVRRIAKSGGTKTATTLVTPDNVDQLDAINPLFGKDGPASPLPPPVAVAPTTPATREPVEPTPYPPPETLPMPATTAPRPIVAETPTTAPMPGPVDNPEDDRPRGSRRLATFGMVGGGVMVLVGVVFWASASNVEDEIKDAPNRTRKDLEHIKDLEAEGDAYAMTGNVLAIGGLILGGVSTYYFMKGGKRPSRSANVTPILGNGTGIAITWGGSL